MTNRSARRARWAVAEVFAVHGCASGSFAARIPWIADHLRLDAGALGLALLMPAIGALSVMAFTGRLVDVFGGKNTTRLFLALWSIAVMVLPLAPNRWVLMAALLFSGATAGTTDMAMNGEGVAVEKAMGRSIMSGLHGMWSVGALAGAGIGTTAAYLRIGAPAHLASVGAVLLVAGFFAGRGLADNTRSVVALPRFSLPRGPILLIALIGLCATFAECAAADWAAVYLRRMLGQGESVAAAAYATFASSMAIGRLCGDYLVNRFGVARTVRSAALLGVLGGGLVVVARSAVSTTVGFGLIGIGVAIVLPLAFAAAGHSSEHPANAIAGVATVSYGAGLAAPALVGGIAQVTSLRVSFALVTALIAVVAVSGERLAPASPEILDP